MDVQTERILVMERAIAGLMEEVKTLRRRIAENEDLTYYVQKLLLESIKEGVRK